MSQWNCTSAARRRPPPRVSVTRMTTSLLASVVDWQLAGSRRSGIRGLEEGFGCLGGDLLLVPAEFPGLEVVDDRAEPAGFGVDDGALVLGLDQGDPGHALAVPPELGIELRQAGLDGCQAPVELIGELVRVEGHGERQGDREDGYLLRGVASMSRSQRSPVRRPSSVSS